MTTEPDWRRIAVQIARYGGSYYGLTPAQRDLLEAEVREVNETDREVVADRTADAASYHEENQ